MSVLVPIFLFSWPVVVLGLFSVLRPLQAVVVALVGGWLFLPVAGYALPGLPDYTKISATSLSLLMSIAVFDPRRFSMIPMRAALLPLWIWMLVAGASALANGFGLRDAMAQVLDQFLRWGVPFIVGIMYFRDRHGMKALLVGIIVGAIVYLPLVLYELRMAPVLHHHVFGFSQHSFVQTMRFGGWRPMVFLDHGLALSMWYACAAVAACGIGFFWRGSRLGNVPFWVVGVLLLGVCVACKSVGAIALMACGLGILVLVRGGLAAPAYLVAASSFVLYFAARIFLRFDFPWAVSVASAVVGGDRAASLGFRLDTEAVLVQHASSRFLLGWSSWGRNVDVGHLTDAKIITDSLWIIAFGQNGIVGLASLYCLLLGGVLVLVGQLFRKRTGVGLSQSIEARIVAILALMVCGDSLFNAMPNPVWMAMAGGLLCWSVAVPSARPIVHAAGLRAPLGELAR